MSSKVEQIQSEIKEVQDKILTIQGAAEAEQRDLTTQEADDIDALLSTGEKLMANLERAKRIEAQAAALSSSAGRRAEPAGSGGPGLEPTPGGGDPPRGRVSIITPENQGNWGWRNFGEFAQNVYLGSRKGATPDARFYNAPTNEMQEAVGADGGFAVPPDFRDGIQKGVMGEDSLLSQTEQMTTASNSITLPKDETTPWGTAGIRAYWEGEASQLTTSKQPLTSATHRLNKLTALVPVTEELLEDSSALASYLMNKVPEAMDFAINLAIIQGNGVGQPLGILNGGDLITVAKEGSQAADTLQMENITKMWSRMYARVRPRAVWLINQDIEPQLLTMGFPTAATAVPVYLPVNGLSATPYATLLGRPVIPTEACNTLGDKGDIIFAALGSYLTVRKTTGIRFQMSIHLWFDYDETAFKFVFRLSGAPMFSAPIAKRSGSNTLSRFVTLAERA